MGNGGTEDDEIMISLKNRSNCWRSLEMPFNKITRFSKDLITFLMPFISLSVRVILDPKIFNTFYKIINCFYCIITFLFLFQYIFNFIITDFGY